MNLYLSAWSILSKNNKKNFFIIIFLFVFLSLLEIIGIALVIPFVAALFNPESLSNFPILNNYTSFIEENKNILLPLFCIFFFSIFLFKNLFLIFTYKFTYSFNSEVKAYISTKILKKFFNQNYLYFVNNSMGKLSATMSNETSTFSGEFLDALMIFLSECILLIGIFILIILAGQSQILIIILPILLFTVLILKLLKKKIKAWAKLRIDLAERMVTVSQRIFIGVRDIYFSRNVDKLLNYFYSLNKNQSLLDAKTQTISIIPRALLELMGLLVLLIALVYFNKIGISNEKIISTITFYFVIAYRALPSFSRILVQKQRIKYSENSVRILKKALSLKDERILHIPYDKNFKFKKEIRFNNISFSYLKNKEFLKNENFEVKRGKILGIYGQSGSGKSTLLNLITFLINPDSGKIYLDDVEVSSDYEKRKFQNIITFISQDTFLIEDTLKNNITFSSETEFDNDKLNTAIKLAKVDKFINDLPGQLDYMVGSHGRRISSGQKQRIVIARAFYDSREIFVLDEATNAIDEETERQIYQNIVNEKKDKTIIIVSHNKSNLLVCDDIYTVKEGKIFK